MSDNVLAGWTVLTEWPRLRLGHSVRTDRQLVHYPIQREKVISYLQQLFGNSTLHLYDRAWSIAMLCGVARQPGLWSHWKRCSWKSQEPLFTRNVGNRDLRCFLSVTFRRLRGGGGSIVCVSCTVCIKAKVHRRYLSFFRQLFKLELKSFDLLTRFGFHLHLLVDICHPFSVFLSVSGTLFRPLPYLRVAVFLPSGLFFTLSTKQISFL